MKTLTICSSVFIAILICSFTFTSAEVRTITGTVTAKEDGSVLPAVSVVVKGTSVKVSTDSNGKYEIKMPDGSNTLVFEYIGYQTKEYILGKENVLSMVLEADNRALSEVVTTGKSYDPKRMATAA
jgi:hypothetical protein